MAQAPQRLRRRERKNITAGVAHVNASFNNTMITITDAPIGLIPVDALYSPVRQGAYKVENTRVGQELDYDKLTLTIETDGTISPEDAARKAMEHGLKTIEVNVAGPGSGRDSALRALQAVGFHITSIRDVTPIPHNGGRPPKRRRV